MAEKLATPDGKPIDVPPAMDTQPDEQWSEHMREMAEAADTERHPAPPKKGEANEEAPYGYKPDGTPRKRPGRAGSSATGESKPRVKRGPKAAQNGGSTAPAKDYRPALDELLTGVWGLACLASPADAGAVLIAKPALVAQWHAAAQQSPRIGRVIDTVTGASAVGLAVGTTVLLALQLAANHGRIDGTGLAHLGIRSREECETINLDAMRRAAEDVQAARAAAETSQAA